jgi:hypothetical protein
MIKIGPLALAVLLMPLFPIQAKAYCSEPQSPSAPGGYYKPSKPSKPFCINEYSGTHTCDNWTIQSYNSSIDQYNSEVEDYIRKLNHYLSDVDTFSSEAMAYAKCEINDL